MADGAATTTMEQVTLSFAEVDVEYRPIEAHGSLDVGVHFKFDLLRGSNKTSDSRAT